MSCKEEVSKSPLYQQSQRDQSCLMSDAEMAHLQRFRGCLGSARSRQPVSHGVAPSCLGRVSLQSSSYTVAAADERGLVVHRLVTPVRHTDIADPARPCCRATLLLVRQLWTPPTTSQPTAHDQPLLALTACTGCGRTVGTPGQRCPAHSEAALFEVWRVRSAPRSMQHSPTVRLGKSVPPAAGETLRQHSGTQARLLFASDSVRELAAYLGLQQEAFRFVDHWGSYGTSLENVLIRPGTPHARAPPNPEASTSAWHR